MVAPKFKNNLFHLLVADIGALPIKSNDNALSNYCSKWVMNNAI